MPPEGGGNGHFRGRQPTRAGAGDGNRTHVCSLGSCRSTIELRPRTVGSKGVAAVLQVIRADYPTGSRPQRCGGAQSREWPIRRPDGNRKRRGLYALSCFSPENRCTLFRKHSTRRASCRKTAAHFSGSTLIVGCRNQEARACRRLDSCACDVVRRARQYGKVPRVSGSTIDAAIMLSPPDGPGTGVDHHHRAEGEGAEHWLASNRIERSRDENHQDEQTHTHPTHLQSVHDERGW